MSSSVLLKSSSISFPCNHSSGPQWTACGLISGQVWLTQSKILLSVANTSQGNASEFISRGSFQLYLFNDFLLSFAPFDMLMFSLFLRAGVRSPGCELDSAGFNPGLATASSVLFCVLFSSLAKIRMKRPVPTSCG